MGRGRRGKAINGDVAMETHEPSKSCHIHRDTQRKAIDNLLSFPFKTKKDTLGKV